ncbi:T9SS type A sorting domain-containing protein [Melioribacteraceae bacterium 4301-Me]|uniref:T9SS type A sorting domain-containing protein n=1 Tax=Pyranulibacter aquaticus TaxID=3163344 RepID=UPI0035960538
MNKLNSGAYNLTVEIVRGFNQWCLLFVFTILIISFPVTAQWVQTDGPFFTANVQGLTISGSNLLCSTTDGIWQSSDNGNSWIFVDNGPHTSTRTIVQVGTRLFAATTSGVFVSTDNGMSWTQSNSGLANLNVWTIVGTSNGDIYAGTAGGGVFRSTNNGVNWAEVNTGLNSLLIYSLIVKEGILFAGAGGANAGVYRSTNNGTSWTFAGVANHLVSSFAVLGTDIFAGTNGGVFRSTDNGLTWTSVNANLTNGDVRCLAVSGLNLFAGTYGGGVFLSTNNGQNWVNVNSGLTSNITALFVNGTNIFAGGWGSGVYLSNDNGANWIRLGKKLDVLSLMPLNTQAVLGTQLVTATWGNGIHIFYEYSQGWSGGLSRLPTSYVRTLAVTSDTTIFAGTFGQGVFRSDYGLLSWTAVNNGLGDLYTQSLTISGSNILVGTYSHGIYRSSDKGNTWQYAGLTGNQVRALKTVGTIVFAGTVSNGIYRSTDNGNTWWQSNNGLDNKNIWSFAVLGQYIFVATDNGVYRSSDNGVTWTLSGLQKKIVLTLDVVDSTLFAGTYGSLGGSVFSSTDYGGTWVDISAGLTTQNIRTFAHTNAYLYVGTEDAGVWRRSLSQVTSVNEDEEKIPQFFTLYQNYPNPFNPSTTIRFSLPQREHVTLKVFDILGREVAILVDGELNPGEHSVVFDASSLPSGVYFYRLQTGGYVQQRKMVVVK